MYSDRREHGIFLPQVTTLILTILVTYIFTIAVPGQVTFTGPGFTIVDGAARVPGSCSTVNVSGITGPSVVRSVSLDNANHSWLGDLEVRLYPPGSAPPPSTAAPSGVISSPPDGRPCNLSGVYRFIDTASQSVDAATVGCANAANLPSGDYRTSTYGGGTNPGPVTSLTTTFGTLTPAQANGPWLVCVFDFATPDGGAIGATSIVFATPTASAVSLGGRVRTSDGRGISKTVVNLQHPSGQIDTAVTNPFGYYRFDGVALGSTYVISVSSKSYTFGEAVVVHHAVDDNDGVDFIANP